ncbi:MAG TPA: molecular chaperone HtpG [Clostridiaceae bacterium]|nr:molecular chaperone HtpG [Clostridiaceae bacterium]
MPKETGTISINTENILPIIKRWLYSEKEIFVRELISNCSDAISKLKRLKALGEAQFDDGTDFQINVVINKKEKTLAFIDNGIGMTGDEVKKYINQIAFSGVRDFIEKYKDKADENQIIGHFGLGFYSAFMVASKVQIDTLSYLPGSQAVRWVSTGDENFEMEESNYSTRGTRVTLYLSEDCHDLLDEYKMRELIRKYCFFLPYGIYLETIDEEPDSGKKDKKPEPLNDTKPLWLKDPKDCTDEEYKEFYRKVFLDFNDPLFWIHLNVDYPFRLKGILYFPKLRNELEMMEGQIKLYYNQVFVADNIKEIIPEFLLLLKGTIDCPDLPLNVSRSFLQNDKSVASISGHITKKVADKLSSLFNNERETYNKYWNDIHPFVKYGCMKEPKFFEKVKGLIVYKTTSDDYVTLEEYLERNKSKHENTVFYVTDEKQQAQYIKMFKEQDMEAIILTSFIIDSSFIQFLEFNEKNIKFYRVDSNLSESLKEKSDNDTVKKMQKDLEKLFRDTIGDEKLKVQVETLKSPAVPGIILLSEQSRRIREMSRMYGGLGMDDAFPEDKTLVLNASNEIIKSLMELKDDNDRKEDVSLICRHIYDLAIMGNKQLEPDEMTAFIERSSKILLKIAK